jgi:hypothetical protein
VLALALVPVLALLALVLVHYQHFPASKHHQCEDSSLAW